MKKITFFSALICLSLIPSLVHGADFYFEQSKTASVTGEEQILLKLKTGSDRINAISGRIEVPEGVDVSKINTGSSAILMWIDQPQPGKMILFAGITPGGFQGDVHIFSFAYTKKVGTLPVFKVIEAEASKDDGLGTTVPVSSVPFTVRSSIVSSTADTRDIDSPEPFSISIGRDDSIFNGSYFASFLAQDKKSGVHSYQFAHSFVFSPKEGDWQETESPVVLDKTLVFQKIYIKAVDAEGNTQISTVDGPYRYVFLWIGIILVLTLCALFFFVRHSLYRSS